MTPPVLDPLRHLGEMAVGRATRRREQRRGHEALGELERRQLTLPQGLELEWLGVSGYRISYQGKTIFVDPYISRVPLRALLRGGLALPDETLLDRWTQPAGEVLGVLVGHTHFDHAVDAPAIARRFGCDAYGSQSLQHLMSLHRLAERTVVVEPYRRYELGPFTVSFTPSVHSKLLLGLAVPMDGELSCEHLDALSPRAYRCGEVFAIRIDVAGISFYHQGSANLIDDAVRERGIDVFLAGVAGRNFTPRYWSRILRLLEPQTIVPTHYDNFFAPLGDPMSFVSGARLGELEGEIEAVSRDFELVALPRNRSALP
ncbi:MAG TPA: MBL fold metallo-hydrolase [Solirubrobacteraceae bacterium]|jgi:L-ascorbate metabolism protein UlaG (beta-lactamase superfamily)